MTTTDLQEVVVARYGELWLKGKNRGQFERRLQENVRHALRDLGLAGVEVRRDHGQLIVTPPRRVGAVARRLERVFGIASLSLARSVPPRADDIVEAARACLREALESFPAGADPIAFRVDARRSDKSFPLTSPELEVHVADALPQDLIQRLRVDLRSPDLTLGVNVRHDRAYVFAERREGAGGLPVGTLGRAICLLSGGIDSPVAAWMTMKRGCEVEFVSFHSHPFLGEASKRKIEQLVRELAAWQSKSRLHVVPFADAQVAIRDAAPEGYRTILYRRMMQRIAARLARKRKAGALVTGESLGQVASQTLENITCIEAASSLPVLRPLIAFDKTETIALSRRIGTFDVSIRPEPDCCTVFQPSKPVIRGRLDRCDEAEAVLDVEGLVERALDGIETVDLSS